MLPMSPSSDTLEVTLREVVETLAPLDRTPCSPGEREAAEWLHARLSSVPGVESQLEDEPSWGIFAPTSAALGLMGIAGAALVLGARRQIGALLAAASFAGIVDEPRTAPAWCGEPSAAAARPSTSWPVLAKAQRR
jgi:hypothetical protein